MARSAVGDQRRKAIAEVVAAEGFSKISDLAEQFAVTPMTIHRDLDRLHAQGVLSKVRSGARATPIEAIERNVDLRVNLMQPQKRAIARAAIQWLGTLADIRVVSVDDSTTALTLAERLAYDESLTIVSNFLPVFEQVAHAGKAGLFAVGGTYSAEYKSLLGISTRETIRSIQIDVHFMSATSVGRGAAYHPSEGPLLVKRELMEQAELSVLLVDHTKFERRALHRQADLPEFAAVITDDGIDPEYESMLRDYVENVIVAPTNPEEST
ncbi:MAG: DeoR/GlpR family DNA-binding transcription regulator [Beutenbergiaceae bacterium]